MEMTAEQKFLKALAEWLDIKTCPKNRIQMASREYLDQFTDGSKKVDECVGGCCDQFRGVKKKVEPELTWEPEPEVGKLYCSKCTSINDGGAIVECKRVFPFIICEINNSFAGQAAPIMYEPIAELEGLKVGHPIYSETGQEWEVIAVDAEALLVTGNGQLDVYIDGSVIGVSNKQLFWRTADRAERLGRK